MGGIRRPTDPVPRKPQQPQKQPQNDQPHKGVQQNQLTHKRHATRAPSYHMVPHRPFVEQPLSKVPPAYSRTHLERRFKSVPDVRDGTSSVPPGHRSIMIITLWNHSGIPHRCKILGEAATHTVEITCQRRPSVAFYSSKAPLGALLAYTSLLERPPVLLSPRMRDICTAI